MNTVDTAGLAFSIPGWLIFMLCAWAVVLSILFWSFRRLLKTDPSKEQLPPPGSIP